MKISRRNFLVRTTAALPVLVGADALAVEPNVICLESVEVPIAGLGRRFDGYRIGLLADIHFPMRISERFVRSAVRLLMSTKPDLLVVVGDFVDREGIPGWEGVPNGTFAVPKLGRLLEDATAPDGVLGVLGNHDHYLNAPGVRDEIARSTAVRLIENSSVVIERGAERLAVGGVGDIWEGVVDPASALAGIDVATPRVLLSHNPDLAEDMDVPLRVDLQLSGHTHGGEVRLPFGPAWVIPSRHGQKFRSGLVQGLKHRVYVTRGICSPRGVRFWCPPEVTSVVLRSA